MKKINIKLKIKIFEVYGVQADLAAETEISESVLSRIVCGRRTPTPEQRKILSQKLKTDEIEIFECED